MRKRIYRPSRGRDMDLSRRRFVLGLVTGGVATTWGLWRWPTRAADSPSAATLHGREFNLTIGEAPVNYTGRTRVATAVNATVPGPTLHWREGERVTVRVTNRLPVDTSIHWHGILLPSDMDGVPGLSFPGIAPGQTFVYRFDVRQSGTYWYHAHSGMQEQTGLYGALIIDPANADAVRAERDYVVMLSDWTDENPERVYSKLKMQSDYYNFNRRTVGEFVRDVRRDGWRRAMDERRMWNQMRMSPTDIADVTGATYTYLMNGTTPAGNWTGMFKPGERVRLRFINGSSMTFFDVRIPGLKMTVVQADGQDVDPVRVDEFRIGVAETYDVVVEPDREQAYTIFAQAMDRSGYARGTLASRAGATASVPPLDPRPVRTMVDMGMAMNHDRSSADHGRADGAHDMESMPGMDMSAGSGQGAMAKDDMQGMPGMDHGHEGTADGVTRDGARDTPATGMDHGSSQHDQAAIGDTRPNAQGYAPNVDMRAANPTERLNDAGDGLQNDRRVLTYADLIARIPSADGREPTRELQIHLTGNMMRYIWSFDGRKYSQAEPIHLRYNERVRVVLINDTMMEHPIHLHGMFVELDNGHGARRPRKHTVIVKPGERLSYLVTADARGRWAYHCHLLYHMMAGMFREVRVV